MVFILANIADPDEMPNYAAFHLSFTVFKSIQLGVISIKRATSNVYLIISIKKMLNLNGHGAF